MISSFSIIIITLLGSLQPSTPVGFSSSFLVFAIGGTILGAAKANFYRHLLNLGSLVDTFYLSLTEVDS